MSNRDICFSKKEKHLIMSGNDHVTLICYQGNLLFTMESLKDGCMAAKEN